MPSVQNNLLTSAVVFSALGVGFGGLCLASLVGTGWKPFSQMSGGQLKGVRWTTGVAAAVSWSVALAGAVALKVCKPVPAEEAEESSGSEGPRGLQGLHRLPGNLPPLERALKYGQWEDVEQLLSEHPEMINQQCCILDHWDHEEPITPLQCYVIFHSSRKSPDRVERVARLIELGADPNVVTRDGQTLLGLAHDVWGKPDVELRVWLSNRRS